MMLSNGDGTYTGGPLDLICILKHETQGTFHAAFFEEHPMPGPIKEPHETDPVRLKIKFSHTAGKPALEEAQADLDRLAEQIKLQPTNVWRDKIFDWDGGSPVWVFPNWMKA